MTAADFLPAILAAPDDDTPRLVLADWYDENGQPDRAEFIRVQCEIDRHPARRLNPDATYGQFARLRQRERELFDAGLCRWEYGQVVADAAYRLETADDLADFGRTGPLLVYRRGWVDEVRCPLAAFVGGRCDNCDGMGHGNLRRNLQPGDELWEHYRCPVCDGTGRTPGLAKALFAAHPLQKITLTDREPLAVRGGGVRWWESDGDGTAQAYLLPTPLYASLVGPADTGRVGHMQYPTREAAVQALSAACVRYGRGLNRLPALTTH